MNRVTAVAAAAVLAAGCADRGVVDVSPQQSNPPRAGLATSVGDSGLTVMTWNVYYGVDPMPILLEYFQNPGVLPTDAVAQVWNQAQNTDFPQRATELARLIAANHPQLVGLQEAALWRTGALGTAEDTAYDFIRILTDALRANGLEYVVAAVDSTTDITLPTGDPLDPSTLWIRLTDRDAVLARADVQIGEAESAKYGTYFPVPIPGLPPGAGIYEGWSSVVATVGGRSYRFVSTHLEIKELALEQSGDIQVAQAHELLNDVLGNETRPTIVVGDFNSYLASTDPVDRTSYQLITGSGEGEGGFTDSWLWPSRRAPGLTCCQNADVNNYLSTFDKRVDYIFGRDMSQALSAGQLVMARDVVGDEQSDKTTSGLWPSDHGGVVATFRVPPATSNAAIASK